jgi:hypothetical protein
MIVGIRAITLAAHDMACAIRFYRSLGFEILYGGSRFIHDLLRRDRTVGG